MEDYLQPHTDVALTSTKKKYHNNNYARCKDGEKDVEYKAVIDYITKLNPRTVLEIGCGNGHNIRSLSKVMKKTKFYGIDISDVGIEYAKRNSKDDFRVSDARHLPFDDNSMDLIFTVHALEQMKYTIKEVSKEIYRVCRNYIVLFEPYFVMQNIFGKWHNIRSEYVQGIEFFVEDAGFDILEFKLLTRENIISKSFNHKTGVLVGEKKKEEK